MIRALPRFSSGCSWPRPPARIFSGGGIDRVLEAICGLALRRDGKGLRHFYVQGQQKPFGADLIAGLFLLQLPQDSQGKLVNLGIFLLPEDDLHAPVSVLGQIEVFPRYRKHIVEQRLGIQENVGPEALRAGSAVGGMRHVLWDHGHIAAAKRHGFIEHHQTAAVSVADAYLQAIVEMQPVAGNVGNLPVIPGKQQERKLPGKTVASVFCNGSLLFRHKNAPFYVLLYKGQRKSLMLVYQKFFGVSNKKWKSFRHNAYKKA